MLAQVSQWWSIILFMSFVIYFRYLYFEYLVLCCLDSLRLKTDLLGIPQVRLWLDVIKALLIFNHHHWPLVLGQGGGTQKVRRCLYGGIKKREKKSERKAT